MGVGVGVGMVETGAEAGAEGGKKHMGTTHLGGRRAMDTNSATRAQRVHVHAKPCRVPAAGLELGLGPEQTETQDCVPHPARSDASKSQQQALVWVQELR